MARSVALPLLGVTLLSLAVLGACQDGPVEANGVARVQILLTDAPSDYLETAEVWISRVVLVPGENDAPEGSGFVDLFNDPQAPQWFDLLTLRDGITAELSEVVEVPEGRYAQLRLVVDSARVTLRDGYTFRDGTVTKPLFVPSGSRSGIKVQLADPVEAEDGGLTILTVDFDVDRNFVMQGNPETPAGIQGILFTPVLQEKERTGQP
jgi:hypothetical protein